MKRSISLLVAVAVVSALLSVGSPSHAADSKPTLFGMATSSWRSVFPEFAAETGHYPAFRQVFWHLNSPWTAANYPIEFEDLEEMGSSLYAEIMVDDFDAFLAGDFDGVLATVASRVRSAMDSYPGVKLLVAPFPEMNLSDWDWGHRPADFKTAYGTVRQAFLDAGLGLDEVRFVFSVNGPGGGGYSYIDFYPGNAIVDIVGFSRLNRNAPWLDYESLAGQYTEALRDLTLTKPILLTQTGSVTEGQDRAALLTDLFENVLAHEQVIGALYFNRQKIEGGKDNDYRIATTSWVDSVVVDQIPAWSPPSDVSWIFDGSMDAWVASRAEANPFDDIGGSPFQEEIIWMRDQGITVGCGPGKYCPTDPVTRGQMAIFLNLALPDVNEPATNYFDDDDGSTHELSINGMAVSGITLGCGVRIYCPTDSVTRAQMASFMVRALDLPSTGVDFFADDNGSVHEDNINRMAASGITMGCSAISFCGENSVTREQMAAFLYRALSS